MGPGSQQYCLRWNHHRSNLLTVFEHLLQTEAFTDVTLAVAGTSIKCHKMVLAACSSYFQSLFLENSCPHPIVVFKDIQYADIRAILEYMYRGEVNVAQEQVGGLLKVAEILRVKGLYSEDKNQSDLSGVTFEPTPIVQTNSISTNSISTNTFLSTNGSSSGRPPLQRPLVACPQNADFLRTTPPVPAEKSPLPPPTVSRTPERTSTTTDKEGSTSSETMEEERDDNSLDIGKPTHSPALYPDHKEVQLVHVPKQGRQELKRYRQYTRNDISAAIDAVRSGMSALQASRIYGVPSRTLYDKVKKLGIVTGRPYRQSIAVAVSLAQGGGIPGVSPRDDDDSLDVQNPRYHALGRINPLEELGLYFASPAELALSRAAAEESRLLRPEDPRVVGSAPIDLSQGYDRVLRSDSEASRASESAEKSEIIVDKSA